MPVDAPYALTPRSATPVDDRVSFGELAGVAELDTDRKGDIYFVTVSEPQPVGARLVGGRRRAVQRRLTDEDRAAGRSAGAASCRRSTC